MGGIGDRSIGGGDGEGRLREEAVIQGEDREVFAVPLVTEGVSVLGAVSELLGAKIQRGTHIAHVYP